MIETSLEREGAWLRVILEAPPGNLLSRAVEMLRGALADARERSGSRGVAAAASGCVPCGSRDGDGRGVAGRLLA